MTREEREISIEYLKEIKENYIEGYGYERHPLPEYYAIENAIKALEQELCEDAISRKEIISHIEFCLANAHDYKSALQETLEKARNTRSVQPKQKIGHWINKQRLFDSCSAKCSSCHKRSNGYMHDNGFTLVSKYYDFCPKCGAKMVEPQESEEKE